MAEKLGLGTEVQELKIGQSFFQSGPSGNGGKNPTTYHTVRYDFKPASSSTADSGYLQLDETNKGVSVTVPHVGGGQTNFSGHQKKANQKECILIIDRATGEITLERLSSQILVKKTRPEKPEKSNSNIPPPPPSTSKPNVAPPPPEIKPAQKPCQLPATVVGNDRQMQRSQSPAAPRHQQQKKQQHPVTSSSSSAGAASDTKPTLSEDLSLGSSSDSSSSSASESSDDSDDDNDPPAPSAKPTATSSQPPPPSSFSMPDFLSDDFGGHSAASSRGVSQAAPPASTASSSLSQAKAQPISMPQLLNHDLELSESDSE